MLGRGKPPNKCDIVSLKSQKFHLGGKDFVISLSHSKKNGGREMVKTYYFPPIVILGPGAIELIVPEIQRMKVNKGLIVTDRKSVV